MAAFFLKVSIVFLIIFTAVCLFKQQGPRSVFREWIDKTRRFFKPKQQPVRQSVQQPVQQPVPQSVPTYGDVEKPVWIGTPLHGGNYMAEICVCQKDGTPLTGYDRIYVDEQPILIGRGRERKRFGAYCKLALPESNGAVPTTSRDQASLQVVKGQLILSDIHGSDAFGSDGRQRHGVTRLADTNRMIGRGYAIFGEATFDLGDYLIKIRNLTPQQTAAPREAGTYGTADQPYEAGTFGAVQAGARALPVIND